MFENFHIFSAAELIARRRDLPQSPAVYLFLVRDGDVILETSGYFDHESKLPRRVDAHYHLYTGASATWGARVESHLVRDAWASTLRRTLVSLEQRFSSITSVGLGGVDGSEEGLSSWLAAHARIAVAECSDPFDQERAILRSEPSPLNIDGRRLHAYSQVLQRARNAAFPKTPRPSEPPPADRHC